jgi:hypothetical protein
MKNNLVQGVKRMSKQQQWTKLMKNLPTWVSGAISLATTVISFVLLIQGHYNLGVTILGMLIIVAFLLFLVYLAFTKAQPDLKRGKKNGEQVYRFEKYRPLAFVGIALELVLVIAIFSFKQSRSFVIEGFTGTTKGIELVDLSVINDGPTLALDIKLRNIGDKVAIIKLARIHILDYEGFNNNGCVFEFGIPVTGGLPYSAEYDFDISDLDKGQSREFNLSQVIPPNEADRIKIALRPQVTSEDSWLLNKISLELIYNEDNQSIIPPPIIFISSTETSNSTQSAELLYGLDLSDADILAKFDYLLKDPFYNEMYNQGSKDEFLPKEKALELVRDCYKNNLLQATQIFSEEPVILSDQARREYNEWQKAISVTP